MQLHHRIDALRAAGAELYEFGNGSPSFIDGFRETTGYDGPLYTDPSLAVYQAAGLKRGVATVLSPRAALAGISALRHGFRQGKTQGDAWQQGGVVVIEPGGDVVWTHVSDYAGDNAAPDEILRQLQAASRST